MLPKAGKEVGVDLPIRIVRGPWPIRLMAAGYLLLGLVCLVLAWLPLSDRPARIPDFVGLIWMVAGLMMARAEAELLCEIGEGGIRAPEGIWRRSTFVPWEQVARCEIIPDDNERCGSFVLRDRSGHRRFGAFSSRLIWLTPSERTRILRALQSRFPQEEKPGRDLEPAPADQASSALWDRDLDG